MEAFAREREKRQTATEDGLGAVERERERPVMADVQGTMAEQKPRTQQQVGRGRKQKMAPEAPEQGPAKRAKEIISTDEAATHGVHQTDSIQRI